MNIRRATALSLATLFLTALSAGPSLAQPGAPPPPPPPGPQGGPPRGGPQRYDKAHETTLTGQVQQVQAAAVADGSAVASLMLQSANGPLVVRLAPPDFLAGRGFSFAQGDQIEVTGSPLKTPNGPGILARQIKVGNRLLILRDDGGQQLWAPRGKR